MSLIAFTVSLPASGHDQSSWLVVMVANFKIVVPVTSFGKCCCFFLWMTSSSPLGFEVASLQPLLGSGREVPL
jgi:hypothetical protein